MPELPEVETVCRGLEPHLLDQTIQDVQIRNHRLRWPIAKQLPAQLKLKKIIKIYRRAKYILLTLSDHSHLMIHLGMTGQLRLVTQDTAIKAHDHVDILLKGNLLLRYTDARRFGSIHQFTSAPEQFELLKDLGPEPLTADFNTAYLVQAIQKRKAPIKTFIMDNRIVVGVGNIYANEALYLAKIKPTRAAGSLTEQECKALVAAIKKVLTAAIKQGGTSIINFINHDGKPGYFKQKLKVYGRASQPCFACKKPLKEIRLGQRTTVFCDHCQV